MGMPDIVRCASCHNYSTRRTKKETEDIRKRHTDCNLYSWLKYDYEYECAICIDKRVKGWRDVDAWRRANAQEHDTRIADHMKSAKVNELSDLMEWVNKELAQLGAKR